MIGIVAAAGVLLAGGCGVGMDDTGEDGTGAAGTQPPTSAAARTPSPHTSRPAKPPPTPRPVTVEAPCPYADAETISLTIGERIARTTVTRTRPHPGCTYYRADGRAAAQIQVSVLASPTAAQTRAIAIGGKTANPIDGIADGGVVTVDDAGSVLAVSTGRTLVVVRINQQNSLGAKNIARAVVSRL